MPIKSNRHYWFLFIALAVACALLLIPGISLAQVGGGLEKGTDAAEQFREWLWLIIPIACTIAGLILAFMYSADLIRKDTLWQWGGGVFFGGILVGAIIKLFFS
ncbi:hypothetical protein PT7_0320 [Pusillimonas sp. T7-7]|uniref:TrbC/VirB2 family protein n=1 Tax=Pusillimonas sp. (strain T7-7) TaxID=1007105 RepID=UPI0002084C4B|nr:TrbC/VirB2 family protein [Pusillimonas sp. T7-7]AEC18860.1 hypothetical protein PT7_0320 [Pusillimonas sp. T7-7]